jgi:hypothetical protein
LEAALKDEESVSNQDGQDFVEVILETSDGLDLSLNREDRRLNAIVDEFRPRFKEHQRTGAESMPYLWTHNMSEQTASEEAIRADQGLDTQDLTPPPKVGRHDLRTPSGCPHSTSR